MKYSPTRPFMHTVASSTRLPPPKSLPHRAGNGTRYAQCTHITMTQMWSTGDFICSLCHAPGSMGWLWRCTQDRELLLEDDLKRGVHNHMDAFAENFPLQKAPRKGSPESRLCGLSFLNEITTEQAKGYTTEQLVKIMEQRANVLKVANSDEQMNLDDYLGPKMAVDVDKQSLMKRFSAQTDTSQRNWLPSSTPGFAECQFKCCQRCRPINRDRGYISLDAVANGEYPATAITGFGFHIMWGERPVHSAEIVRNIGLRPSPKPVATHIAPPVARPKRKRINRQTTFPSSMTSSPFNDEQSADTTFGQPATANFYDSTAMARSLNDEGSTTNCSGTSTPEFFKAFRNMFSSKPPKEDRTTPQASKRELPSPNRRPSTPPWRSASVAPVGTGLASTPTLSRRHSPSKLSVQEDSLPNLYSQKSDSDTAGIGLQHDDSIRNLSCIPVTPTRSRRPASRRVQTHAHKRASSTITQIVSKDNAPHTPLPSASMEEERREGGFTDNPLQADHGVAFTEEALALHIPDIITQV